MAWRWEFVWRLDVNGWLDVYGWLFINFIDLWRKHDYFEWLHIDLRRDYHHLGWNEHDFRGINFYLGWLYFYLWRNDHDLGWYQFHFRRHHFHLIDDRRNDLFDFFNHWWHHHLHIR